MDEPSFIAKIFCALGLAAILGFAIAEAFGGLLAHSAASETQIFWVKGISGVVSAIIGGCLGWAHSQLILTGAIYTTISNVFFGWL